MDKVGSGHLLLRDVNSKLPKVLERIKEIDSALQTVKKKGELQLFLNYRDSA